MSLTNGVAASYWTNDVTLTDYVKLTDDVALTDDMIGCYWNNILI